VNSAQFVNIIKPIKADRPLPPDLGYLSPVAFENQQTLKDIKAA